MIFPILLHILLIQCSSSWISSFQVIPAYDREVSESMIEEYEKRMKSHEKLKDMDVMESHRVAVAKFRQKVG